MALDFKTLNHSTSHLMAEAIANLYPGAKFGFGPAIEEGFYYDIDFPTPITEADLPKIEKEMHRIASRNESFVREEVSKEQALELFKDNLFFENGRHANECAMRLAKGIKKHCYGFLTEPVSNQIFPIFPNSLISDLEKRFSFYVWKKCDATHSALRLVTSWATPLEMIDEFVSALD